MGVFGAKYTTLPTENVIYTWITTLIMSHTCELYLQTIKTTNIQPLNMNTLIYSMYIYYHQ